MSTSWSVAGKVALVTGTNTGIGRVTARELAQRGARVFVTSRSLAKARPVADEIIALTGRPDAAVPLELELGSFASVRAGAGAFLERDEPLHILINNAGVGGQRGITADGFELNFGVNHLGHFLLTALLLERMQNSGPARIVSVASKAHYDAKGIDFSQLQRKTRSLTGLAEYNVSKLANVLFIAELARRLGGGDADLTTYALHPGVIKSDVWRRMPWPVRAIFTRNMLTVEQGATTSLRCASAPELSSQSGRYYHHDGEREPNPLARDEALARELWQRSERWCGVEVKLARAA